MEERIATIIDRKYERYAQAVIEEIKSLGPNCMQSGPDSPWANVWEEWVVQIQGQESAVFSAYEETIRAMCRRLVGSLPEDEQLLLASAPTVSFDSDDVEEGLCEPLCDVLEDELYWRICNIAADEELGEEVDE